MTRVRINLTVFALLATATIVWSVVSLFDIDQLDRPYVVTAEFESSPGLRPGFQVTYLGTQIGSVRSVDLEPNKSIIKLRIDRGVELPAEVEAQARRQSAIGEPYVNLSPKDPNNTENGPRLADGDLIGIEDTQVPINYADLFQSFDDLVNAIEPAHLETLMREVALALDGRGDELRTLVVGARDLSTNLVEHADAIDTLIGDLGDMARIAAENRDSIESSLDALTDLSESLGQLEPSITQLLDDAPPFVALLSRIFEQGDEHLLCALDALTALDDVVTPEVLAALSQGIDDSTRTRFVLEDIVQDDGIGLFDFTLTQEDENARYPEPAPHPVSPTVGACAPFAFNHSAADGADRSGPGAGGRAGFDDEALDVPPARERADVSLAGSSELGEPDDPFLARVMNWAVPALAIGLLAAAAWLLFGFLRNRREAV